MASSKQAEKEHDNYNRYNRLLQDVAPKVLRKLLETRALSLKQVSSIGSFLADSSVKNTLQQYLVKIRVLRQYQLDLLYPPNGSAVNIEDWDITLLCTVLKNTCNLPAQELANVEKIRNIRNSTSGHKPGTSLSNQDFNNYWTDLSSAIDDLLAAINDQSFNVDTTAFVSFIRQDKDTDLFEEIVKTWLKDEDKFVETQACRNVQDRLQSNDIVTIGGVSGSGKSGIAHHVALRLSKQGYTIYPVCEAEDIKKYANIKKRQVFVVEDPVGKHELDWNELRQFEKFHQNILSLMKGEIKVILTCRKNILNDEHINSYESIIGMEIVDLSSEENRLTEHEKKSMFDTYAAEAKLSVSEKMTILKETFPNFPLLCKVFGANIDKLEKRAVHFFTEPISVLLDEVKHIKDRDRYKYCSLILCLIFKNNFDIDHLDISSAQFDNSQHKIKEIMYMCGLSKEEPMTKIEHAFKTLVGILFIQEETRFRFIHDVVFDVVALQFGGDYPSEMLKYCSSNFIREYVRTEAVPAGDGDEHIVRIKQNHYTKLTERFYSDLGNGEFHDVFLNPSIRDQSFVQTFCRHTRNMKRDDLVKVYFRTSSNREVYKSSSNQTWSKDWFVNDCLDDMNTTAIHWVMAYNHFEIFCACRSVMKTLGIAALETKHILLKLKSKFTRPPDHQLLAEKHMVSMACLGGNMNMFNTVLQDNPNVNLTTTENSHEQNALYLATLSGNIDLVEMLMKKGIDIRSSDFRGVTPLFVSAAVGHSDICTRIIQQGVNVNEGRVNGTSALFIAAQEGRTETVAVLLKQGANVNQCRCSGSSPLQAAAGKGHVDAVSMLLDNGALINHTAKSGGRSPLHIATEEGQTEVVRLLLKRGADVNLNSLILQVAVRDGNAKIVHLLLEHGASSSCCYKDGFSPLYAAAYWGYSEIVSVLLQYEENVDLCHSNGFTPLHIAALRGNTQVVTILLQYGADTKRRTRFWFSKLLVHAPPMLVHEVKPESGVRGYWLHDNGVSALHLAVLEGNAKTVKVLLQKETDVDQNNAEGDSLLYVAAREGNTDTVAVLLQHGVDINIRNNSGFSPLYIAAMKGRTETVDMLLQHGADINLFDNDGDSPLHVAAMNKHSETVSVLLKHKADINLCTNGFSPLYAAASLGNAPTVSVLLQNDAEVNLGTTSGDTPLYRAVQRGSTDIVSVLLQFRANVNQRSTTGCTPLIAASKAGNVDVVEALLASRADVDMVAIDTERTALMEAAMAGYTDIVQALLASRADVDIQTIISGRTALMEAVREGYLDVVQMLLDSRANMNIKTYTSGRTALMGAAKYGRFTKLVTKLEENVHVTAIEIDGVRQIKAVFVDIVKTLLASGADLNTTSIDTGQTALMEAAAYGFLNVVEALLASGADVNAKAKHTGRTALMEAAIAGYVDVVQELLTFGAEVNNKAMDNGRTALMEAATYGKLEIVEALLASGADVDIQTIDTGRTALMEAAKFWKLEIVEALLTSGADVNIQTIDTGRTALMEAAKFGSLDVLEALLDSRAELNIQTFDIGRTALMEAAKFGFSDIVEALLASGADTNTTSIDTGQTVLMEAATYGFLNVVEALLASGADVNAIAKHTGRTSLMEAVKYRHLDVITTLLGFEADVEIKAIDTGRTALMEAAKAGYVDVVQELLTFGADVNNMAMDNGRTALIEAAKYGQLDVLEALLVSGGDVNIQAIDTGRTALMEATKFGFLHVVEALLDSRAELNIQTFDTGRTALMEAARYGFSDIVEAIIAAGANVNIRTKDSATSALSEASTFGHTDVENILFNAGANATWQQ